LYEDYKSPIEVVDR